jgi:hypothetical protein
MLRSYATPSFVYQKITNSPTYFNTAFLLAGGLFCMVAACNKTDNGNVAGPG